MNPDISRTKRSFDKIASGYDSRDDQNAILRWMRGVVHKIYLMNIPENGMVLELNAGTGTDALFLAGLGMRVYATDISEEMINVIKAKIKNEKAESKIIAEAFSFDEIDTITESGFDAVVSNFGGLNCINDFSKLSHDIGSKLNQNGKFIAVVMSKICPWEIFYYFLGLDFKNAFRRFNKKGVIADLNGEKIQAYYFKPKEFGRFFRSDFNIEKIYTLGYFTPPPYLIGIYNRLKPLVKLFMKIDDSVNGLFPFNRFGDHFIIVMSKR